MKPETGTIDFFASQETARRKTGVLILYYILAVVLIVGTVYLAVAGLFLGVGGRDAGDAVRAAQLWNPELFLWVTGATLLVVITGTWYRIAQLRGGGKAVATLLGGRPVARGTPDPDERKVLNVVEEMAIASGVPVPPVYVLDGERGINAFAAGFTPNDAVIGVTRGCIAQLSRDELQGVIAHEFSHILNGDMRLNIRLMGVLHGILVIAVIGMWVFRSSLLGGRSRSREKGNSMPFLVLGLALMAIGGIGVFFGKLIKSAVSRQREFLADASAVQFTRNPDGIAGALRKIAAPRAGSRLGTLHADEAGHFLFANGVRASLAGLMATHPPIEERIRRLQPIEGAMPGARDVPPARAGMPDGVSGFAAGAVAGTVGVPDVRHVRYAEGIESRLPAGARAACREPVGARAVVYGLLTLSGGPEREVQRRRIREHDAPAVFAAWEQVRPELDGMAPDLKLPLAEMAVATLKELDAAAFRRFRDNVEALVTADQSVDLFEYALRGMILRQLTPTFERVKSPPVRYRSSGRIAKEINALLACLAYWGADDAKDAARAYAAGREALGGRPDARGMPPPERCGLGMLDGALRTLAMAAPALKKRIVAASAAAVAADGTVTVEEGELLRAVADALECPIPPLAAARAAA
jgi:Zn-dependent protease with chaperone function